MPDDGSFYSKIKDFLPVAAATGIGALAGGRGGALMGAAGAAQGIGQEEDRQQAKQEKLLSLMSLIEDRKAREAYQQQTIEERQQFHEEQAAERARQDTVSDQIRQAQVDERVAHDSEMEKLTAQLGEDRIQASRDNAELRASIAGRNAAGPARFDAAVGTLSMLTGKDPGEIGMAMSKAGLSPTGATYVATRAAELTRSGKKPDIDQLIAMGGKAKDQYGTILDNIGSAIEDKKATGAKFFGADSYANYLIAKGKIQTLPPAERKAMGDKIRRFAKASIPPDDPEKAKDFKPPTIDDLSSWISPEAPEEPKKDTAGGPPTLPATTITGGEGGGKAAAAPPKGLPTGAKDNGDGTWTLPDGMKVRARESAGGPTGAAASGGL